MTDVRICRGCCKPIEPDAAGVTRYVAMMNLIGGPAERVHDNADCKLRFRVWDQQRRVDVEQAKLAALRGEIQ